MRMFERDFDAMLDDKEIPKDFSRVDDILKGVTDVELESIPFIKKGNTGMLSIEIPYNKVTAHYLLTKHSSGSWITNMPVKRFHTLIASHINKVKPLRYELRVCAYHSTRSDVADNVLVALLQNCPYPIIFEFKGLPTRVYIEGEFLYMTNEDKTEKINLLDRSGYFSYSLKDLAQIVPEIVPMAYTVTSGVPYRSISAVKSRIKNDEFLLNGVHCGTVDVWSVLYKPAYFIMYSGKCEDLFDVGDDGDTATDVSRAKADDSDLVEALDMYFATHKGGEVSEHVADLLHAMKVNKHMAIKWLCEEVDKLQEGVK